MTEKKLICPFCEKAVAKPPIATIDNLHTMTHSCGALIFASNPVRMQDLLIQMYKPNRDIEIREYYNLSTGELENVPFSLALENNLYPITFLKDILKEDEP